MGVQLGIEIAPLIEVLNQVVISIFLVISLLLG